jgi:triacylglycerol lipase
MCAFHHRVLAGLLAALSVGLFVGLGEGQPPPPPKKRPTPKGKEKPPPKKAPSPEAAGTGCFNLLSANATGPDRANAYLMMLANYFIYGDADNPKAFRKRYETMFRRHGMKDVQFVEDTPTATRVVVMSNDKAVVVNFRGTEPGSLDALKKTLVTDVKVLLVPVPWLPRGARAHQGFLNALESVYRQTVNAIGRQGGFRAKKVFVTGHSLGGALAVLCAARLQKEGRGTAVVHTYGAPRPGNQELKGAFRSPCQRWVNFDDVVPMLPDENFGYRHPGTTNNIQADGKVRLNDREYKGPNDIEKALERLVPPVALGADAVRTISGIGHHTEYLRRLYGYLPANLRQKMPAPPK